MGQSRPAADEGAEPEGAALPDPMTLDQAAAVEDTPPGLCPQTASRLADAPWDLSLLASHADCLAAAGETANAIGLYERVLAFDPRHFQAAIGLARLRAETGDHAAAATLYETAAGSARTDGQAVQARIAARQARERAGDSDN
jgi:thioredoxin-like negative regulator of GroEL